MKDKYNFENEKHTIIISKKSWSNFCFGKFLVKIKKNKIIFSKKQIDFPDDKFMKIWNKYKFWHTSWVYA